MWVEIESQIYLISNRYQLFLVCLEKYHFVSKPLDKVDIKKNKHTKYTWNSTLEFRNSAF